MAYVLLMLFSILANWLVGIFIDRAISDGKTGKAALTIGIFINLLPLAFFKYANFIVDNLNNLLALSGTEKIELAFIHLPIGISFFTFQAISYIVDVYRRDAKVQTSLTNLALYISLFPQLIAGPIVRYHDVAKQILHRQTSFSDFKYGALRFVSGLAKKVLIANNMGIVADYIFSLPAGDLTTSLAWLGLLAYTLQIYYDFSGYSDMAIGLGRMFGFRFLENFNYPYISRSIREFWRRWHISLSSWFRDYLYFPLGGSRQGSVRTLTNLLLIFFLTGLWHGASWTFVVWGLFHGAFMILERGRLGRVLDRMPAVLQHLYVLLVVMVAWVFFRADTFPEALQYLSALVAFTGEDYIDARLFAILNSEFYIALIIGVLFSMPIYPYLQKKLNQYLAAQNMTKNKEIITSVSAVSVQVIWVIALLMYSSAELVSGVENPFLYFRF